jgi:hypothetical protein
MANGDDIVLGGKQFPNPKHIKPVLDTEIKSSPDTVKDRSSPKPPKGFAYYAEPYEYKSQPAKMDVSNAPLDNHITPRKVGKKPKYGKLVRVKDDKPETKKTKYKR